MKKWKCSICGYVHTGDTPPEKCPICGATKDKFVLMEEDTKAQGQNAALANEADILVVGTGGAAFAAAATARAQGASVIMLEKAKETGGTTSRSGGGFWIPNNRYQKESGIQDNKADCIRYMARYSYPQLYSPDAERYGLPPHEYELLEAYYDNAYKMVDFMVEQGILDCMIEINWTGEAQVDYMDHLPENKGIRGRSIYTKDKDGKLGFGVELIGQFKAWAGDNGIEIVTGAEVKEILREGNRVTGLKAQIDVREKAFIAHKGVIFGSGGYSHNLEMMLSFQRGPHFGGCAVPTNTGDFIKMAGSIGGQIGNMAGAFRAQSMLEAYLANPDGSSNVFYIAGDSVIIVNKYGKRIVDEKRNYTDRTMAHFAWDAQKAEWMNMLTFMVYDKRTADLWQGFPPYPVQGQQMPYILKADTLDELAGKLGERLESLKEHTGGFMLDESFAGNLKETVRVFNGYAKNGRDEDFGRGDFAYDREWTTFPPTVPGAEWPEKETGNYTMYPISDSGPYYALIFAAGTLDTNGGPVVNKHAQVLDWQNEPIEGLYGAGNCIASITANAYWGAGSTIGPGMAFGYIAALHALGKG